MASKHGNMSIAEKHYRQSLLKLKFDASAQFEEKGVPMEEDHDALLETELSALENFFSESIGEKAEQAASRPRRESLVQMQRRGSSSYMDMRALLTGEVEPTRQDMGSKGASRRRSSMSFRSATPELSATEKMRNQVASVLYNEDIQLPGQAKAERMKRIHRPVTPAELLSAQPPAPLGAVPPLLSRAQDQPEETHYSYFRRRAKVDSVNPLYRRMMAWKSEATRRAFRYHLPSSTLSPSAGASRCSPDDFAGDFSMLDSVFDDSYFDSPRSPARNRPEWPNPRADEIRRYVPRPNSPPRSAR